jgi:hypothetical protein
MDDNALRQDGTVVATRSVTLPGGSALGANRLSGIAVSADAARIWVTIAVSAHFPARLGRSRITGFGAAGTR